MHCCCLFVSWGRLICFAEEPSGGGSLLLSAFGVFDSYVVVYPKEDSFSFPAASVSFKICVMCVASSLNCAASSRCRCVVVLVLVLLCMVFEKFSVSSSVASDA